MASQNNETNQRPVESRLLSEQSLDAASGGTKWIDIHMPYNDFIKWPINAPSPTRYA